MSPSKVVSKKEDVTKSDLEKTKTIDDFSSQWNYFPNNADYFASLDLFKDSLGGLIHPEDFKGKTVIDLGSGTGRITNWALESGAAKVYSIEPAASNDTLRENTKKYKDQIVYLNCTAEEANLNDDADLAISLGVISYIPDLLATMKAIFNGLKPGGIFHILAMSYEGNELYCTVVLPLRKITTILPDRALFYLVKFLTYIASTYGYIAKVFKLPMHNYFSSVYLKMKWPERTLLIFDQLNPSFAKYYKRQELENIFKQAGFINIRFIHRHGYSWCMVGEKAKKQDT